MCEFSNRFGYPGGFSFLYNASMKKTMKKTFRERVYGIAAKIPTGKVATYGQIAKLAGNASASRAVGMCLRGNTDTKNVPCHRVVASNGALTGYAFGGVLEKRERLLEEGVVFAGDRVDLDKSKWKE